MALLATGFIFTIHFFNTHFRPDKFPMDPVIFTGRVTVDELKYDKPAEYEQLVAEGKSSTEIADIVALSPKTVETYRSHLMRKLDISDLPSLVKFAIRHGLTPLE